MLLGVSKPDKLSCFLCRTDEACKSPEHAEERMKRHLDFEHGRVLVTVEQLKGGRKRYFGPRYANDSGAR